MDLATATPAEIDAQLAELWTEQARIEGRMEMVNNDLKSTAGFKFEYIGKQRVCRQPVSEALEVLEAKLANPNATIFDFNTRSPEQVRRSIASREQYQAALAANDEAQRPLMDEFDRRGGWSRFFLADCTGGHVHSSTRCSTCNKGRYMTSFKWDTDDSGKDEDEIVALMGVRVCTICFPSAPVEGEIDRRFWTTKEIEAEQRREAKTARDAEKARKVAEREAKRAAKVG